MRNQMGITSECAILKFISKVGLEFAHDKRLKGQLISIQTKRQSAVGLVQLSSVSQIVNDTRLQ